MIDKILEYINRKYHGYSIDGRIPVFVDDKRDKRKTTK